MGELRASGFPEATENDLDRYVEYQSSGKLDEAYELRDLHSVYQLLKPQKYTSEELEFVKNYERFLDRITELKRHAVRWFTLFNLSKQLNFPIKAKPKGINQKVISTVEEAETAPSNAYCAVRVWLQEIEAQPRLESIDDVLRLRENKFYSDFREVILHWAELLSSGERKQEESIRKDIAKASADLKRLSKWRKVGGWITYISLPVDVAIMISGLPVPTSLVGLGVQAYTDIKSKKYQWLMFSQTVH